MCEEQVKMKSVHFEKSDSEQNNPPGVNCHLQNSPYNYYYQGGPNAYYTPHYYNYGQYYQMHPFPR